MSPHPLASIDPTATIGCNVRIGPFCVIEQDVAVGDGCTLEGHVVLKRGTQLGSDNHVHEGAVIGGWPQHAHMPEHPGTVTIGCRNTIRENVTIHRALEAGHETIVGDDNLLMVNAHIAHDCRLGNKTIITNNVMLAGHVTVGDRAYLSGGAAVHQFCRVGTLAMVGGQAHMVKDVPPYVTVDGLSSLVVGLNQIGLRRAGHDLAAVRELKAAYRLIYRSGLAWAEILRQLKSEYSAGAAEAFYPFLATSKRGITSERRLPMGATVKFPESTPAQPQFRIKAG